MIDHPFNIFREHKNLHVALFTKKDPPMSDDALGHAIGAKESAALWQMHGNRVIRVRGPTARTEQADGMMTDVPGIALLIRAADCQNFVIFVPKKNILGMLHVGWRGLEAGAIPSFFQTLESEFGIKPRETFIGAGPSLCKRCADFSNPTSTPASLLPSIPQEYIDGTYVDLMRAAEVAFETLGVRKENFERMPGCTRCEPERFWTYRGGDREEVKAGKTNVLAAVLT